MHLDFPATVFSSCSLFIHFSDLPFSTLFSGYSFSMEAAVFSPVLPTEHFAPRDALPTGSILERIDVAFQTRRIRVLSRFPLFR